MEETSDLSKINCPLDKVKELSEDKTNILLAYPGSFFPYHINHARTIEMAKKHMEEKGYNVIGGYIIPSPNVYVEKKLKEKIVPPIKRLKMLWAAVEESDWLSIDPSSICTDKHSELADAFKNIEKIVGEGKNIVGKFFVVPVIGVDSVNFIESLMNQGIWVLVQNRPSLNKFDAEEYMKTEKMRALYGKVEMVIDHDISVELSASDLRFMINEGKDVSKFIPKKVLEVIHKENIVFPAKRSIY